jgi:integrase
MTIRKACSLYVEQLRITKGQAQARDAASRFDRWINDDKLADVELTKLARPMLQAWRRKLVERPVVVNPHARQLRTRNRAPASVNREMTALRAALNFALDNGYVTTDVAWRVALRPIINADRRRAVYLERSQRTELIAHAEPDLAAFLRALAVLPLRPGALAALTVASFDKRLSVLKVGKDKSGQDRKMKLPPETGAFLAKQAKDKLPAAPLLARANGSSWNKDAWKKPIKAAARAAGLKDNVTAYSLRHSAITDLVVNGRLDLLTVAQISGTSVAMIERHYGHLSADRAMAALATLTI